MFRTRASVLLETLIYLRYEICESSLEKIHIVNRNQARVNAILNSEHLHKRQSLSRGSCRASRRDSRRDSRRLALCSCRPRRLIGRQTRLRRCLLVPVTRPTWCGTPQLTDPTNRNHTRTQQTDLQTSGKSSSGVDKWTAYAPSNNQFTPSLPNPNIDPSLLVLSPPATEDSPAILHTLTLALRIYIPLAITKQKHFKAISHMKSFFGKSFR